MMETATLTAFLATGFGWGMVHAFDPDHLAAVAGASVGEVYSVASPEKHESPSFTAFAVRWSLGHGLAIALVAMLVFLGGMAVPESLSAYAENAVPLLLIGLGSYALFQVYCHICRARVSGDTQSTVSRRSAVIVGVIHGIAGSAPLLALIPLSSVSHPAVAFVYVLFFSAGVFIAMTSLGSVLGSSLTVCSRLSRQYQALIRCVLALFSILLGFVLLI